MKKLLLFIGCTLVALTARSQGLDSIIVERYYVSEPNDTLANADGGILPVGSVTYRIYADLAPGYKFQIAYGVANQELRISTTTLFFNNEDRGSVSPNFTFTNAARNTVMLDSWLSCGRACNGYSGVLKSDDDGVNTIVNNYSPQVLQGTNPLAGIPLTQQDGMVIDATTEPFSELGITNEILVFDNQNDGTNGPVFSTFNGSWYTLNGATGADSISNRVLLAQITTDGQLCFTLNLQLTTPTPGVVLNYVATNPTGNDILFPGLNYCSSGVGVPEFDVNAPEFSIYPNPGREVMSMWIYASRNPGRYSYRVYSIDGRMVMNQDLGDLSSDIMEKLDISGLQAGQYMVEVSADGKVSRTRKIVRN